MKVLQLIWAMGRAPGKSLQDFSLIGSSPICSTTVNGEAIRIAPGLANRAERERYPSSPPWISGVAGVRARLKSGRSGFDSSGIHHSLTCPCTQMAKRLALEASV